ncbi:magnesium transporter CorA family protein [Cytobacillus purgationiresistens]|nr:magnesium transporter CorA family protein [Cytobacillus purgationiresistens]
MEWAFNENKWKWFKIDDMSEMKIDYDERHSDDIKKWYHDLSQRETNRLRINTTNHDNESISGTLIYQQKLEAQNENRILHFFLTKKFLITINAEVEIKEHLEMSVLLKKMDVANQAIDGFFVLLGEMLNESIINIDKFEIRLNDVLWKIKKKNGIDRLEEIYKLRHELLIWKNFIIPFEEIRLALEEAFGEGITSSIAYKRTSKRMERSMMLIKEYQEEIDHLVNFEEMVSTHRGNEIIKTLTVITTLFTPVSAWGALWGMNFKFMPELGLKWGYGIALCIILLSTLALYYLLVKKGWTGDTLRSKKKNTFFK